MKARLVTADHERAATQQRPGCTSHTLQTMERAAALCCTLTARCFTTQHGPAKQPRPPRPRQPNTSAATQATTLRPTQRPTQRTTQRMTPHRVHRAPSPARNTAGRSRPWPEGMANTAWLTVRGLAGLARPLPSGRRVGAPARVAIGLNRIAAHRSVHRAGESTRASWESSGCPCTQLRGQLAGTCSGLLMLRSIATSILQRAAGDSSLRARRKRAKQADSIGAVPRSAVGASGLRST